MRLFKNNPILISLKREFKESAYSFVRYAHNTFARALRVGFASAASLALTMTILVSASLPSNLHAQFKQAEKPVIVDKVIYKFEGPKNVSEGAVNAHVRLRSGMKFDQKALDQSIRSLYNTGLYEFIEAQRSVSPEGKMDITFTIVPKYKVGSVVFRGNKDYSGTRLKGQVSTYAGSTLSEIEVKRDTDKLKEYYQKKGYSLAKVTYTIERNDEAGVGAVIFDIDEGNDVKIMNIRFTGDPNATESYGFWGKLGKSMFEDDDPSKIDSTKILAQMKTDSWIMWISYLTDNGRFKEQELQDDIEKIRKFYRDHGFLDVVIDESKIKFEFPDPDEPGDMDIVIDIQPNKQYFVGDIKIKGNKIFTEEQLKYFIQDYHNFKKGDVFSPTRVDDLIEKIRVYYGEFGYIDTIVRALRRPNLETGNIDLTIDIIESGKYYLESINIQGNTKTKSEVILRELALAPGDVFDLYRMKISESRLKETRFFEEVTLSPETTSIPNRRDLRVVLKEGRTGNLIFGAGFSTIESLVATVEVSQSNFDYEKYDSYFQGAGQKFRLRGTIGLKSNQVIMSFEEPWVFNRELGYGIDLYRTDTGYYSDYYSEVRLGGLNYLRKRIYELVEARLAYKLELVDIYDVSKNAPQVIKDETGSRSISQASLTFLRDDRDSYMMPTRGTRFEIVQDIAGGPLMGQTNLYRVEARAGYWVPTFDFGKQVFSIVGRMGSVMGYGGKDVPFFEKCFLGGGYNMRGFKYRKVGPIDPVTEEPLGGNSFGFVAVEYSIELFNPVRFAVFYDWGFVNSGDWDFDPSNYNSDFGVGFRVLLMGAPMRIDVGFPLKAGKYNDDGMQFNFSFGTVF